jgi:hypothetical protein
MSNALSRRLLVLEACDTDQAKQLPQVVPDDTPEGEIVRLRKQGRDVYRESDPAFIELFI